MSKPNFSPGRWHRDPRPPYWIESNCGEHIATVWHVELGEYAEPTANLIVSAPDLYEALLPFSALLQGHMEAMPDNAPVFQITDAVLISVGDLRRAAAAIARANGEWITEKTETK